MSHSKGPLGSLQDDVMFNTTPSFGTESLGKPRPGKLPGAHGRSVSVNRSSIKRTDGDSSTPKSSNSVSLPKLPGAQKVTSPPTSPLVSRQQPKPDTTSSPKIVTRSVSPPTAATRTVSQPTVSSITGAPRSTAGADSGDGKTTHPSTNLSSSAGERKPRHSGTGKPSTTPSAQPKPTSHPISSTTAPKKATARGGGGGTVDSSSNSHHTKPQPQSKQIKPASVLPTQVKRRPKSSSGARGGASGAPRPPEIETLADVEDLRRRQNEQLLWIIEAEQAREKARLAMLSGERNVKRREALERGFAQERQAAQDKIEGMKRDNEAVLVAHMTRLGFAR